MPRLFRPKKQHRQRRQQEETDDGQDHACVGQNRRINMLQVCAVSHNSTIFSYRRRPRRLANEDVRGTAFFKNILSLISLIRQQPDDGSVIVWHGHHD